MNKNDADFIVRLLNCELESRKSSMMSCIDKGLDPYIKERIEKYREALNARNEFRDWMDDKDFEEGESNEK